jgi:hypothetical protein
LEVASIFLIKSFSRENPSTRHHIGVLQLSLFFEYDAGKPALALVPKQLLPVFCDEGRVGAREAALCVKPVYG